MNHIRSPQRQLNFQYLDDYVRRFVAQKTGLRVQLDLRTGLVAVKSLESGGSVALAMFWAKVLQHKDNYPTDRVHYYRNRDSQTGAEGLLIRVEDVAIQLSLSTGLLEISGPSALIWLKKRFLPVLRTYDGFKDTGDWYEEDDHSGDYETADAIGRLKLGTGTEHEEAIRQSDAILDDVWQGPVLQSRLERAKIPSVQATADFVRPLMKSLLARWLSDEHTQICLVTTELDSVMLGELARLARRFKSTASFSFLCAPFRADPRTGSDLPSVRLAALQALPASDQMWLEYKLLRQFTSPMTSSGLNLVAGVRLGGAQVLVTSAPFHSAALERSGRADLVQFLELAESVFLHDFIQPLNCSVA